MSVDSTIPSNRRVARSNPGPPKNNLASGSRASQRRRFGRNVVGPESELNLMMRESTDGFTLIEILVSIAVVTLIVVSVSRLLDGTILLIDLGNRRAEADNQVRRFLDRIAIDFDQMLLRSDVDYYLKTPANPEPGNDQIAFFSEVPGYYPSTCSQSPISLVGYRLNGRHCAERLGKGLLWNGVSSINAPIVFQPQTIIGTWPAATNDMADSDYEIAAANIFRFEYYYLLKGGRSSTTPWDVAAGHTTPDGMRDVTAIPVAIATIDPKSRVLLSDAQLTTLATRMNDFAISMGPGDLPAQWQSALDSSSDMPRPAVSGIRIHSRYLDLKHSP